FELIDNTSTIRIRRRQQNVRLKKKALESVRVNPGFSRLEVSSSLGLGFAEMNWSCLPNYKKNSKCHGPARDRLYSARSAAE
ncbi:hypothetical protein GIB67_008914, partial [Kingdonia uniflora]